jgi:hypothetical protein
MFIVLKVSNGLKYASIIKNVSGFNKTFYSLKDAQREADKYVETIILSDQPPENMKSMKEVKDDVEDIEVTRKGEVLPLDFERVIIDNDFFEGNLAAITAILDYIAEETGLKEEKRMIDSAALAFVIRNTVASILKDTQFQSKLDNIFNQLKITPNGNSNLS